jgi:hypothetical protein
LTVALAVGVITAIGGVLKTFATSVTKIALGLLLAITAAVSVIFGSIVKILSLPFRPCIGDRDPISPLGTTFARHVKLIADAPETSGVVNGQIRYVRENVVVRPPSYRSGSDSDGAIEPPK